MSTAIEMQLRQAEAQRWLDAAARVLSAELFPPLTTLAFGREVCARRARKLRKRGDIVQFYKRTPTGKCRYKWMPPPLRLVMRSA